MNERVTRLRQESLDLRPWLSIERAALLTEFCQQSQEISVPVRRALAFQYLMEHKTLFIGEGELIVGERGPSPKGAPTFPELCCHTMEDLEILDAREKTSYRVSEEARQIHNDRIIPYWRGRSLRDLLFREMTPE